MRQRLLRVAVLLFVAGSCARDPPQSDGGIQLRCGFDALRSDLNETRADLSRTDATFLDAALTKRVLPVPVLLDAAQRVVTSCRRARHAAGCVPTARGPQQAVAACVYTAGNVAKVIQVAIERASLSSDERASLTCALESLRDVAPFALQSAFSSTPRLNSRNPE